MKRIFTFAALLLTVCALTLCIGAAGTIADTEAPALTVPPEDEVEGEVVGGIDRLDEALNGAELWETAKAWVLSNLSTVVGAIMAIITATVGLATKFSFVPKIVKKVQAFATAVGEWYDRNTAEIKNLITSFAGLKTSLQDYLQKELKPIIEKVEEQSRENLELRAENKQLRIEYIKAREQTNRIEGALLEYSKLSAEEFYNIIQQSDLTKDELNKHYDTFHQKVKVIESAFAEPTEGSDAA